MGALLLGSSYLVNGMCRHSRAVLLYMPVIHEAQPGSIPSKWQRSVKQPTSMMALATVPDEA